MMRGVKLLAGWFTPSRGLCGERVSHIEEYLSRKSREWDWQTEALAARVARLEARVAALEAFHDADGARAMAVALAMSDMNDVMGDAIPAAEGGDAV